MSIFFHGSFRTGSTLIWSALRANRDLLTYFEPLHEALSLLPPSAHALISPEIKDSLHQVSDEDDVFAVYRDHAAPLGGVPGYRKSFSYDEFFLDPGANRPHLEAYISSLVERAHDLGKTAGFKFVRSAGRAGWMKQRFEGHHIGVVRDALDQFRSYLWNAKRGNPYFFGVTCLTYARNVMAMAPAFEAKVRLPLFHSPLYAYEVAFYEDVAKNLTLTQLYFVFYAVWKKSLIHTVNSVDFYCSFDAGKIAINRLADTLGEFGAPFRDIEVRPSKTTGSIKDSRELRLVEDLVDWMLNADPQHEKIDEDIGLRGQVGPEIEDRIWRTVALQQGEYTLDGDLGEVLCAVAPRPHASEKPLFGLRHTAQLHPHEGHRQLGDDDNITRLDPSSLYLGPDVNLEPDPEHQTLVIRFETSSEVAAFGPHRSLPPGDYEIEFEYECAAAPGTTGDETGLLVEIVAEYGQRSIAASRLYPTALRSSAKMCFQLTEAVVAFEPRFQGINTFGRLFGYKLTLAGPALRSAPAAGRGRS